MMIHEYIAGHRRAGLVGDRGQGAGTGGRCGPAGTAESYKI